MAYTNFKKIRRTRRQTPRRTLFALVYRMQKNSARPSSYFFQNHTCLNAKKITVGLFYVVLLKLHETGNASSMGEVLNETKVGAKED